MLRFWRRITLNMIRGTFGIRHRFFRPFGAGCLNGMGPTAGAVGCVLSPLRS
jgi:hypothetical protein